jgi:hypothetical protein
MSKVRRVAIAAPLLLFAMALSPLDATAQMAQGNGYTFGVPKGSLSLRFGYARPSANSDVFRFTSEHLTLDRNDFAGFTVAGDAGLFIKPRLEATFGVGFSSRRAESNYRDFVDTDDLEIEQETTFRRIPLTFGLRYYLAPIGRRVGSYAWVPSRVVPYVAAGGGGMFYEFRQQGDFVDFQSLDVFAAELESYAWTPTGYGAVGLQYAVNTNSALVTELRYDAAKRAPMSFAFQGFDDIDLSGASMTFGLHFRF